MGCCIVGCGKGLPALDVTNDELATLVDTSDEWISTRTGIRSRRISIEESSLDLAETAARQALGWEGALPGFEQQSAFEPEDIDLVLFATLTPDALLPSSAALLRRRLGLVNAVSFDLNAACSGFVYSLTVAEALMAASQAHVAGASGRNHYHRALVVGAERLSRITNWQDRNTCVLFGDGAGAVVVEWRDDAPGIISSYIKNDDDTTNSLVCPASFDSSFVFDQNGVNEIAIQDPAALLADASLDRIDEELGVIEGVAAGEPRQSIRMDGQKVFKFAGNALTNAVLEVLNRAELTLDDIALIVPHQANERIIKYAAKKLGLSLDRFQISIEHRGNSSAACVPMTLSDAYDSGKISPGDKVIMVAFGAGLTSGAVLYEA